MRAPDKGQSILEYIMVTIIVISAIIVGGPYMIRAVQSYFKMTDESVQDAASENIQQDGVKTAPADCTCSGWEADDCGLGQCSATQRTSHRICKPMHCDMEERCDTDAQCNEGIKPVHCGSKFEISTSNTYSTQSCPAVRAPLNPVFDGGFKGTCVPVDGSAIDCAVGERLYSITRGNPANPGNVEILYGCKADEETRANCLPVCWEKPFDGSSVLNDPANPESAPENDNNFNIAQREALIEEVIYRQITFPTTTLAKRTNSGDVANNPNHRPVLKDHNPLRMLTTVTDNIDPLKFGAFRNHYVYLRPDQARADRFCERLCPAGFAPNAEGYLGGNGNPGMHENVTCVPDCSEELKIADMDMTSTKIADDIWRIGTIVDDQWHYTPPAIFKRTFSLNIANKRSISSMAFVNIAWDDHILIKVNDHVVFSGEDPDATAFHIFKWPYAPGDGTRPPEKDGDGWCMVTGENKGPAVEIEQRTSWCQLGKCSPIMRARYPALCQDGWKIDIKPYIQDGNNPVEITMAVGGGGELWLDLEVNGNFCENAPVVADPREYTLHCNRGPGEPINRDCANTQ
jgi:hypothetical protein